MRYHFRVLRGGIMLNGLAYILMSLVIILNISNTSEAWLFTGRYTTRYSSKTNQLELKLGWVN